MKPQSDHSDSLVFERDLDEPPEKVWRALTEPRLLQAWLTPDESPRIEYEILTAEPHRRLSYRWRERESGADDSGGQEVHSVVTVELTPVPTGGTHLKLTHGEFRAVSAALAARPATATRVRPITSARRGRAPTMSFAAQTPLRRAA